MEREEVEEGKKVLEKQEEDVEEEKKERKKEKKGLQDVARGGERREIAPRRIVDERAEKQKMEEQPQDSE